MTGFSRDAFVTATAALALASAAATTARAQDTAGVLPNGSGKAGDAVQDITVTAERRDVKMQDTNLAVTALGKADLTRKSVVSIGDLQFATPSLSVVETGFSKSLNIRGLGLAVVNPALIPGVATYRDGVFLPTQTTYGEPFFDMASVEVLRGPQGTSAGQAATAGAVFINTKSPSLTDGISGDMTGQVGNYGDVGLNGALNMPISSTLAARVAFNVERRDSFFKNIGSDFLQPGKRRAANVRVGLLWEPSSHFQLLVKSQYNQDSTDGLAWKPIPGTAYASLAPADPFTLNYDRQDARYDSKYVRSSAQMVYTTDGGIKFKSVTGRQVNEEWLKYDNDATSSTDLWGTNHYKETMTTQDFSIISPDKGRFRWVVGATYFDYTDNVYIYTSTPTVVTNQYINLPKQGWGAFATGTFTLIDGLDLEVGGRYSGDKVKYRGYLQLTPGAYTPRDFAAPTGAAGTGKVALNWKVTPDHLLYAFWARGYKPGGVNSNAILFDQEKVNDFEIGWKGTLLDRHLHVQANGFYMDYVGLQVTTFDPTTTLSAIRNAGKSTIKGVELSAQYAIGGFRADMSAAYLNTRIGSVSLVNTRLLPNGSSSGLGAQCSATNTAANCYDYTYAQVNLSGRDNLYSPRWTANAGVEYTLKALGGTLTPRADIAYTAKQWTTLFQDARYDLLAARTLINAQLRYAIADWSVTGYATNLTNKTYVSGTSGNNRFFGAPRQYGVRVARKF